jgi:uncharacterized membrane protein YedE/YeeE
MIATILRGIRGATDARMSTSWVYASIGGVMIGAASALLLLTHGRIAGISGIAGSLVGRSTPDRGWRIAFLGGLVAAGVLAAVVSPSVVGASVRSLPVVVVAGLLVGFGTRLGSGCTSGHGVCGIARMSARSMLAVATFMATGAITAMVMGGLS